MAASRFITSSLALFCLLSAIEPAFADSTAKVSREWKALEADLGLSDQLKKISKDLQDSRLSTGQAQNSIRFFLEKAFTRPPTYDPELGHLLVTSASLSQLPSGITLMEKVINPSNYYAPESWQCALQYLSEQPSEKACDLLIKCLGMPWISLNLSASFYLSQNTYARHDPTLISRLQAVGRRLDKAYGWIIADTLSRMNSPAATNWMRQLYSEASVDIQAQILRLMATMEEDYLDIASKALTQSDPRLQEASLYFCLSRNHVPATILELCKPLCNSRHSKVAQTASITLYKHTQAQDLLEVIALNIKNKELHTISGCSLLAQVLKDGLPTALRTPLALLQNDEDSKIALNASLALLLSQDSSCLESLSSLLLEDQLLVSLQYVGTNSWPFFILDWVPLKNEASYPFAMASQYRSRSWILEHLFRLPQTDHAYFISKILTNQDESVHTLLAQLYSATYQERAEETLMNWANTPGKPWLRLSSTLSLWNLKHNREDLIKLQKWWGGFDWVNGTGYISTLPDVNSDSHKESQDTWLLDFQTNIYFQVTRELVGSSEPQIWASMLEKMSQNQSLRYLPLLALFLETR